MIIFLKNHRPNLSHSSKILLTIEEVDVELRRSKTAFKNHIEDYNITVSDNSLPLLDLIEIVKPTVKVLLQEKIMVLI